jgi:NAD(P)-dependent dehydrogenase (short-subunit alcohol dehydrogenase family)
MEDDLGSPAFSRRVLQGPREAKIWSEDMANSPGSSSFEISRLFALAKARVIMINRKEDQGKEAIEKIKAESNGEARIEWIPCDLSSLKEVRDVFIGIREREKRLDLVGYILGLF